jgi:hypothetical protein
VFTVPFIENITAFCQLSPLGVGDKKVMPVAATYTHDFYPNQERT